MMPMYVQLNIARYAVEAAYGCRVYGIRSNGQNTAGLCFRARLDGPKGPEVSVQFYDGTERIDLYGIGLKAVTLNAEVGK